MGRSLGPGTWGEGDPPKEVAHRACSFGRLTQKSPKARFAWFREAQFITQIRGQRPKPAASSHVHWLTVGSGSLKPDTTTPGHVLAKVSARASPFLLPDAPPHAQAPSLWTAWPSPVARMEAGELLSWSWNMRRGVPPNQWHTERAVLGGGFFEVKTERSGGGGGADTGVDVTEQVTTCHNQCLGTQSC